MSSPSSESRRGWRPTAPIVALTVLAALLRFVALGHQGIWYDEAYTASLMKLSLGGMLGLLPHQESTPPLYYCVEWAWTHVVGDSPAGLRSLSAICGTLTVPAVYVAARKLLANERAALIAAALAACNPLLIWYSQEARAYAMLVLFCACSLAAFAYALERPSGRWLALWALSGVAALTTHYYAGLIVVPEAVWLLWQLRRNRAAWLAVVAVALCGLALVPLLRSQSDAGNYHWIARIPLSLRAGQLLPLALIGTGAPAREALKFIAFAAVLVGLGGLALRTEPAERHRIRIVLGLLVAGLALSAAGIVVSETLLARNLLPLWPAAALSLAAGLGAARAGRVGVAASAVLCAVGIAATIGVDADYGLQRPNWQPVARALGPAPKRGEQRIVLVQRISGLVPLGLYLTDLRRAPDQPLRQVNEIDVVAQRSPSPGRACWWGSACNLAGSALQHRYRIAGFTATGPPIRIEQFRILRLRSSAPRTVTHSAIERALRNTRLNRDAFLVQG